MKQDKKRKHKKSDRKPSSDPVDDFVRSYGLDKAKALHVLLVRLGKKVKRSNA